MFNWISSVWLMFISWFGWVPPEPPQPVVKQWYPVTTQKQWQERHKEIGITIER